MPIAIALIPRVSWLGVEWLLVLAALAAILLARGRDRWVATDPLYLGAALVFIQAAWAHLDRPHLHVNSVAYDHDVYTRLAISWSVLSAVAAVRSNAVAQRFPHFGSERRTPGRSALVSAAMLQVWLLFTGVVIRWGIANMTAHGDPLISVVEEELAIVAVTVAVAVLELTSLLTMGWMTIRALGEKQRDETVQ